MGVISFLLILAVLAIIFAGFFLLMKILSGMECRKHGKENCPGDMVYDGYPYNEWVPKLKCIRCTKFREREKWQERIKRDLQK